MKTTNDIQQELVGYIAAVAPTRRDFTISDFNSQVMMNAYSAEDRDLLQPALAALLEAGILVATSPTAYSLTPLGVRQVGIMKREHSLQPTARAVELGRARSKA